MVMQMLAPAQPHQLPAIVRGCTEPSVVWKMGTGTGKTLCACEVLRILTQKYRQPALHIAPNSVLDQTWEEYVKWYGEDWAEDHLVAAFTSKEGNNFKSTIDERVRLIENAGQGDIVLFPIESFNYEELRDALAKRIWCGVVVDEISRFRNWNRWVRGLLRIRSPHRMGASGSLVVKTCDDLWFPMKWIDPNWCNITNHNMFRNRYCILGGYTGKEPVQTRPDREEEIKAYLSPYCVEADLATIRTMPSRILQVRKVTMPAKTRRVYTELVDTLMLEIERESAESFTLQIQTYNARLQRLLEIGSGFARNLDGEVHPLPCAKTAELIEILSSDLSSPTIVWTWWVPEYKQVSQALTRAELEWVGLKDRNKFNEGQTNIILGSLGAGGFGLNLTRATRMIYHSLSFGLEIYQQSQERNWRLTTDDQPRVIYHLMNRDSMDEYVRETLLRDSNEAIKFTRSSALELLRSLRGARHAQEALA